MTPVLSEIIGLLRSVCRFKYVRDRYGHRLLKIESLGGKVKHRVVLFESWRRAKHTPATVESILKAMRNFTRKSDPDSLQSWYVSSEWTPTTYFLVINRSTRYVKKMMKTMKPQVHIVERNWLAKNRLTPAQYIKNVIYNMVYKRLQGIARKLQEQEIKQPWGQLKDIVEDMKTILQLLNPQLPTL